MSIGEPAIATEPVVPAATRGAQLAAILAISESLLASARDGQWQAVTRGEPHRQRLAWQCFHRPLSPLEVEHHAATLARVIDISRELTRLASLERDRTATQRARVAAARQANDAYESARGAGGSR